MQTHRAPCCDSANQRCDMNQPLNEYPLMIQMLSDQNMGEAWRHVKANKGSPGIDNMSIEAFEPFVNSHWQGLKTK